MPASTDYVNRRLAIILSSESKEDVGTASDELYRYLSEHPQPTGSISTKTKCAIAIDTGNEAVAEIISEMLPAGWRQCITVGTYGRVRDVIRMVQGIHPAMLIVHGNFLALGVADVIVGCAAVSPGTKCVFMHAWHPELLEQVRTAYVPLRVSIGSLTMPFSREEFVAALAAQAGDILPHI